MRKIVRFLLLLAAFSCQRPLFDIPAREGAVGERVPPALPPDTTRYYRSVYATAVAFPDSVDWRKGHTQGARLILFKNQTAVGGVPLGDRPDPERHRFQDGHLWTDTTDGDQTTVSCDGNPLFTYPGQELLLGFLVADGRVHTLGQHPGGGFCYRIDGQEVFSSPQGSVLGGKTDSYWPGGALSRDSTGVYYAYSLPVKNEDDNIWEYRVMKGNQVKKMIPALVGSQLYDLRVHNGTVYRLEYRYGRICLLKDETLTPLTLPEGAHGLRLVPSDGHIRVHGFHEDGNEAYCWIRDADSVYFQHHARFRSIFGVYSQGGETACVTMDVDDCVIQVQRDSMTVGFPFETYRLHTPRCVHFVPGTIALALTGDLADEDNILLVNDRKTKMPFNGYFTGIYIQ